MLVDVGADHLLRHRPAADGEIPPRPEVPAPELSAETGILLQQDARADPLKPLHDLAHSLRRTVGDEDVNMVACDLALMISSSCSLAILRMMSRTRTAKSPVSTGFRYFGIQIRCTDRSVFVCAPSRNCRTRPRYTDLFFA